MDYVIMAFGAVLALVGILLFIKGVQESQSTFKGFGISFNITNPGIVIFIVGCVMFMTPYILQSTKPPAKLESDKEAIGKEAKIAEEERRKAEKERIAHEKYLTKMEALKASIEAEKEKIAEEARRVKEAKQAIERELAELSEEERRSEERRAKEQELAKLKREAKEKEEKVRLSEEIAKIGEAKRIKVQEIAKLQEEIRRKREEAKTSIDLEKRRRLEEEIKRLEKEKLAKENERYELKTKIERKMEIAEEKGHEELAGFTNLIIRKAGLAPVKLIPPAEPKREYYPINIGAEFGDRDVFKFEVTKPGLIEIKAEWTGETERLALILNGPGQVGYYARRDGPSPLIITYDVSERKLNRGTQWQVSVVNFTRKGHATGEITIEYP